MSQDKRIDQLTPVTPVLSDLIALYDVSNPGTKKVTLTQIQTLVGGAAASVQVLFHTCSVGVTETIATLVGRGVRLILRGGIGSGEIITSGIPTGNQILFDSVTGTITCNEGFSAGELLTIQYV